MALNAQDYQSSAQYWVYETPNVTKVEPRSGPQYGGTVITISGRNLVGGAIRDFNKHASLVEPKVRFLSTLKLVNPNNPTSSPYVETTKRNWDGSQSYLDDTANAIITEVQGAWRAFPRPGFENAVNPIDRYEYSIVCTTPRSIAVLSARPPPATLQVSLNGQQWLTSYSYEYNTTIVASKFRFYAAPVTVVQVTPPLGPITGGTLVRVKGLNFTETNQIQCRFGYTRQGYLYKANLVSGRIAANDKTSVECTAPNVEMAYDWTDQAFVKQFIHHAELEVGLNGQQYSTSKMKYLFHPSWGNLLLKRVSPAKGGARGGFTIRAIGQNFQVSSFIKCRFRPAGKPNVDLGTTAGTYVSATEVTCPTPVLTKAQWVTHGVIECQETVNGTLVMQPSTTVLTTSMFTTCEAGTEKLCHFTQGIAKKYPACASLLRATVAVSFDGQLFSSTIAPYVFHAHPLVTSITPTSGSAAGGTQAPLFIASPC